MPWVMNLLHIIYIYKGKTNMLNSWYKDMSIIINKTRETYIIKWFGKNSSSAYERRFLDPLEDGNEGETSLNVKQ
jgi:hypothetical protein